MLDKVVSFLTGMLTEKAARLAASALLLSIVMILVAAAIVSGQIYDGHSWHLNIPQEDQKYFLPGFVSTFIAIWFILYIQTEKAITDIYSVIREKMTGMWLVTYAADPGILPGSVNVPERKVSCEIQVDVLGKLQFVFTILNNPIFENQKDQAIRDVAIRQNDQGGFTIFYYYQTKRELRRDVAELLRDKNREIELEIFGRLSFPNPGDKRKVSQMVGNWYDLNGNIMRIFTVVDLKNVADIRKEAFDPIPLSEVPILQKHYDADMGTTVFDYQGSAA